MVNISFEEGKKIELAILSEIANFCEKENLQYFLAYGTLIGAIRHKGFIPWDDDIDINMPRKDYEYLIENYNQKNPDSPYRVISPFDKLSRHPFVKVIDTRTVKIEKSVDYTDGYLGVDIDIFPLDGQPTDETEFEKWYKRLYNVYKCHLYCILDSKATIVRRLVLPILKFLIGGKNNCLKKAKNLHAKYPYDSSYYVGAVECVFNTKGNRFKKEYFDEAIDTEFEGLSFKIPIGYDAILRKVYGDYMKLPPAEQQVTHHANNMYWKEGENKNEKV